MKRNWRKGKVNVDGNVNWCSHYGKQYWASSKKLKIELPYDLAIPLLGMYLKEMKITYPRDNCTPMVIAILFITAKTWKQHECSLTDEWLKKIWYVCNRILFCHKNKETLPLATRWRELETITLSETTQRNKYYMILFIFSMIQIHRNRE